MRWIRYSRYTGEDLGVSGQDLMQALADYFLESGFYRQYYRFGEFDPNSLEELGDAIRQALEEGALPGEEGERLRERFEQMPPEEASRLIQALAEKLFEEEFLAVHPAGDGVRGKVQVEITDKAIDFLGYKALKDLLGSLGKSSFGAHDTRELATSVEAESAAKPYEFGDTLNLDVSATLFSAIRRQGAKLPVELDYPDLHVHQSEYQSSCATVLMLDCSHSMILYGEDRFTPAKRVALALSHLIRTQYPGDSLHCVLFHDGAEEVRLSELARVQVGPYHTNTRDGLILAQRILRRQRKDMRQIIMITDGKPTAITLENGRVYKNSFGLDPLVVSRTLEEVSQCRRQGIQVNTFMLAQDYDLVAFVRKVAEICRGKAYFARPQQIGVYILMDYMNRKTRRVH